MNLFHENDVNIVLSLSMIIVMAFASLILFYKQEAPYGRYGNVSVFGINFTMNAKTSWILQEAPALIIPLYYALAQDSYVFKSVPNFVLWSMFVFHYINRALIYPLRIRGGKPSNLVVVICAFLFCSWNGYVQAKYLSCIHEYPRQWMYRIHFIPGVILFFYGWYLNYQSDDILRKLRTSRKDERYQIPYGGMFEYISCANYFGEILEWIGFAIASMSLPSIAFAFATILNLFPRAIDHHQWYIRKFDNYPNHRKAIIPGII